MSRHQIEHQTLPEFLHAKPDSSADDVKYRCDLNDLLLTKETDLKEHKAECCYLCDVCKKVFKSQKSLHGHKQRQCHNSCDMCQKVLTFRHRTSCILGQAFHYSPENTFYIFNQQIYFII